jgi:uncharacterized protein YecT (DUF1311 family)
MNAQARAEFVQADAELNKTYEALLAKLPDAGSKEKLKQRTQRQNRRRSRGRTCRQIKRIMRTRDAIVHRRRMGNLPFLHPVVRTTSLS